MVPHFHPLLRRNCLYKLWLGCLSVPSILTRYDIIYKGEAVTSTSSRGHPNTCPNNVLCRAGYFRLFFFLFFGVCSTPPPPAEAVGEWNPTQSKRGIKTESLQRLKHVIELRQRCRSPLTNWAGAKLVPNDCYFISNLVDTKLSGTIAWCWSLVPALSDLCNHVYYSLCKHFTTTILTSYIPVS